MAKTYFVGLENQVKRIDNHTFQAPNGIVLTPKGNADTIWRDVMTHPTNEDKVIIVGSQVFAEGTTPFSTNNSIQISDDAGVTWTTPGGNWDTLDYFYEVWWCENGTDIVAVSAFGNVAVSTDSGLTFNVLPLNEAAAALFSTSAIHALDANNIVIAGSSTESTNSPICKAFYWNGATWANLNGNNTLEHPDVTIDPTVDVGNANGIWMSKDFVLNTSGTVVVATGYTNQVSTDGGATFTGDTDTQADITHHDRSGYHLTWYPSYQIDAVTNLEAFRHTGGPIYNITESTDGGLDYVRTRHYSAGLPDFPLPATNAGPTIRGAHFYTLADGYYSDKQFLYTTSDSGQSGSVIDSFTNGDNNNQINAVWTGESEISNNPEYYTLVDCCDNNTFTVENNEILVLEFTGDCLISDCPANLTSLIITHFTGIAPDFYSGTGCFQLTQITNLPTDPYVLRPYGETISSDVSQGFALETVATCEECCIVYPCYKLVDCEGILDPIYTGTDLSAYLPTTDKNIQPNLTLTPCCGGISYNSALIAGLVPTWLTALPMVIKWDDGKGLKCYEVSDGPLGAYTSQPPGWIDTPLDGEVTVLSASTCVDAALEDPLCDCSEDPEPVIPAPSGELVGTIIQLVGIDGCWEVELSEEDCIDVQDVEVLECFDSCEDCLPEDPAPLLPTNREVIPDYSTGLCDPDIVEKAFCDFADLKHKEVMSKRFQIEICCPKDEDKIWMQNEKIKSKLLQTKNPTPDECNPICSAYQAGIITGYTAITTYVDCDGEQQTVYTGESDETQFLGFCALNTTPPTTVVTNVETEEETTYVLFPIEDCIPEPKVYRQYTFTRDSISQNTPAVTVYWRDENGVEQEYVIPACVFDGKNPCPGVAITFCAEYGSIRVSDYPIPNTVYASNETCPSAVLCILEDRLVWNGDCI
jgi:hypothetical protein